MGELRGDFMRVLLDFYVYMLIASCISHQEVIEAFDKFLALGECWDRGLVENQGTMGRQSMFLLADLLPAHKTVVG